MRRSIFGCRGELTIGVWRDRSDLLGGRLLGGRPFSARPFSRRPVFWLPSPAPISSRLWRQLSWQALCWRALSWPAARVAPWPAPGPAARVAPCPRVSRRVRGRRGCAQGWFRRGVGRVVRSILRICHPAAPLPFLVGCSLSKVRACFGWTIVPRRQPGPPRPGRKARSGHRRPSHLRAARPDRACRCRRPSAGMTTTPRPHARQPM